MSTFSTTARTAGRLLVLALLVAPLAASAQTIQTHNTGTVTLDVYDNGIIGAGNNFTTPGFFYNGADGLFEGQFILGASETQVSGSPYDVDGHEWLSTSATTAITSPFPGFPEAYESSYNDLAAISPLGVEVTQRTYSSSNAADQDYVLLQFIVQNNSSNNLTGLYAGIFADYDVGDFTQNLADYDGSTQTMYVWDVTATNTNYYGTTALSVGGLPVSGWNTDVGDGFNPTEMNTFTSMTTTGTTPAVPDDRRTMVAVGPFDLAPGESQSTWFAMVAGDNETDLLSNAAAAQAAPVPVELVNFNAVLDGGDVTLTWSTASETNNAGFEVQLQNGDSWTALGFVEGNGTTTEAQRYSYDVGRLDPGTHVFRLKQIDYDGAFEYHGNLEVAIETPGQFVLLPTYPNPFNPEATVRFAVRDAAPVTVTLHDALGRQVSTLYAGTPDANQTVSVRLDGTGLPSGLYLVRLSGADFSAAQTVTLLK